MSTPPRQGSQGLYIVYLLPQLKAMPLSPLSFIGNLLQCVEDSSCDQVIRAIEDKRDVLFHTHEKAVACNQQLFYDFVFHIFASFKVKMDIGFDDGIKGGQMFL
jgi:hypothetical protein